MGIEHLLQQTDYNGEGYAPVVDYGAWRVALLNYHLELLPENITAFHCHDRTEEVFVLLQGRCKLYIGEADSPPADRIVAIHCIDMLPGRVYNVRRGVWHSHTPDKDAKVLIVENRDTDSTNSRELPLTDNQRADLVAISG
jgi:mannose-6-phosphate isomerase-like protein (cupin superfamily)